MERDNITNYIYFTALNVIINDFIKSSIIDKHLCKNCLSRSLINSKLCLSENSSNMYYEKRRSTNNDDENEIILNVNGYKNKISFININLKKIFSFVMKQVSQIKKFRSLNKLKRKKQSLSNSSNKSDDFNVFMAIENTSDAALHSLITNETIERSNSKNTFLRSCIFDSNFITKSENEYNSAYSNTLKAMEELCNLLKETLNNKDDMDKMIQKKLCSSTILETINNNAKESLKSDEKKFYNEKQNKFDNIIEEITLLKKEFIELRKENKKILRLNTKINKVSGINITKTNEEINYSMKTELKERHDISETNQSKSFQSDTFQVGTYNLDHELYKVPKNKYKVSKSQAEYEKLIENDNNRNIIPFNHLIKRKDPQSLITGIYNRPPNHHEYTSDPLHDLKSSKYQFRSTCDITGVTEKFSIKNKVQCLPLSLTDIELGNIVKFTRNGVRVCMGLVQYIGELPNQKELFIGLELERNDGIHDGTYCGKKYFKCKEHQGIFISFQKVIMIFK